MTSEILANIPTKQTFTALIEKVVREEKMSYIEAILHLCEEREIDPLDIGKLITPSIKAKVEAEAMKQNLLPKSNSLDEFIE
jgi:hypothetical protein